MSHDPSHVFHEYLGPHCHPFHLRDFVRLAQGAGLSYVADAAFNQAEMHVPPDVTSELDAAGFVGLEREQAIDLMCYRHYRASILCHADAPRLKPLVPGEVAGLRAATLLEPRSAKVRLAPHVTETFVGPSGVELRSARPFPKATLAALGRRSPASISVTELANEIERLLAAEGLQLPLDDARLEGLYRDLVELHTTGVVELRLRELPRESGEAGHALARYEGKQGARLTTPYHIGMPIDEATREYLTRVGAPLASETMASLRRWGLFGR